MSKRCVARVRPWHVWNLETQWKPFQLNPVEAGWTRQHSTLAVELRFVTWQSKCTPCIQCISETKNHTSIRMHNMFWCVSWCFMYCKYIRLLSTTRPYMSISLYQSIPIFVLLSPILYIHTLTVTYTQVFELSAISCVEHPKSPSPRGVNHDQPGSSYVNLHSLQFPAFPISLPGPWVLGPLPSFP